MTKGSGAMVLGLTGQSGAGKTTVSQCMRQHSIPVIDCDLVAHDILKTQACKKNLRTAFPDVFDETGEVSRKELGKAVFGSRARLECLNKITHPLILEAVTAQIAALRAQNASVIVLDAPTLFESGADALCDHIIGVIAPEAMLLPRLISRDSIDEESAKRRLFSQQSADFFKARCDDIIENDGDLQKLEAAVSALLERLGF